MTSAAVAVSGRVTSRVRGVITSVASLSRRPSERSSRRAAVGDRSPSSALRRATAASSPAPRASSSSSRGSNPSFRTIALASRCSARTRNPKTVVNARIPGATAEATASGLAIARFLGPSSPSSICRVVASAMPSTTDTAVAVPPDSPTDSSGPSSSPPIAGSAR